ncbi:hypothetical protein C8R46DRAFT_116625 [Mycena filopes]|nr:hypothetical protein C8R46DRAFT_116625 [Mycena filopes]
MAIRTQIVGVLCILSCALLVAPSAYDKKLAKRDYDDQGKGYAYDSNGGYGNGAPNNTNGGQNNTGGGGQGNNATESILGLRNPEQFCADYLGFTEPYATTLTDTTTSSDYSTTTTFGTETALTTSADDTTIITNTVATTTETFVTTSTSTDVSTSTSTFYDFTAGPPMQPAGRRRAHAAARKRMEHKRAELPLPLQRFNESQISAACSDIVMPQTTTTIATVETSVSGTRTVPATITTATTFVTSTESVDGTETDSSTVLTVTTTATTARETTTLCAESQPISDIETSPDGGSIQFTSTDSAEACCRLCFAPASRCGVWKYSDVDAPRCELGIDANDATFTAPPTAQCPQYGRYILVAGATFVGGYGPCSAGPFVPAPVS